ncbi:amidohydrolase family protein [Conexibacter sp. CPCC 206217]|uniref:amidohydrolase family protein n=1 Tax=Conexibacter sp. CPCC 206217 TaxID=3064574 RepID=UPI00271E6189|nr:amidohydrolase family protein [Conexibacter sp. CPCC 206217]MDO8211705.1 amidohydrolase family protein [Conexibacter sp. CPCC 206217]
MLLDAHAHAFPDVAAGLRWQQLLGVAEPRRSGALEDLGMRASEAEIDRVVLLLWPRSGERHEELRAQGGHDEEQIRALLRDELIALNRWGLDAAARDARFLPFAGINVRYLSEAESVAEIDAVAALGARGIKLIPPSMRLYPDDPLLWPVYRRCAELGLPILSQSGRGGGEPPQPGADHYGRPRYYDEVLRSFPELTLILAHMGLGYEEDVVQLTAAHANVHTDTSLRLSRLGRAGNPTPAELVRLIRRIGVDRTLFGTNYPFVDPRAYRERLQALPLSARERELIAYRNFLAVLPPVAQED